MSEQKRKQYTGEFKREAVYLVTEQGYKIAEAARRLGLNANMLWRWVQEGKDHEGRAFPGAGRLSPEQDEIRRLREENQRLRMEQEILKKAAAFFAKESR